MHAYDAIISPRAPIAPLTVLSPSPMLSPIFNPREFFLLEELLPPKKQGRERSSSSTFAQPQAFEMGESSHKISWNILILYCLVNVDRMAPKRTSTSAAPTMNQAAIRHLIDDRVAAALKGQAANMANFNNTNRNPEPR
nr:hypothetical protein [Tanacetum cinerariifolium]